MPSPLKIDWLKALDTLPDAGHEFERFVRDLVFHEYQDVQNFGFKDGGVDIYSASSGVVWECKFVGQSASGKPVELAKSRIMATFDNLAKHLVDGTTTLGQPQYKIWYDPSIKKYIYCVAVTLSSTQQNEVKSFVRNRFQNLSNRPGLTHLRGIEIEVWPAGVIDSRLASKPAVQLQWFGLALPSGVQTLPDWKKRKTNDGESKPANERNFHSYLFAPTLPYVPLQNPENSPHALLARIESNGGKTLVVHGAGGRGKTRLALEIGFVAVSDGWNVLMLSPDSATPAMLEQLARVTLGAKALFIVDYAERTGSFDALHSALQSLNETEGVQLHLVATTRSKKARGIESVEAEFLPLEKSDTHDANLIAQILGTNLAEFAPYCNGIPVFAAFVRLLNEREHKSNLDALRQSGDFRKWLLEHVQRLPDQRADPLALAELLCAMPSTDATIESISTVPEIELYKNQLLRDGWVVYTPSSTVENWSCAHDLIADGAIIDALSEPTTRDSEAATLLRVALKHLSHIATLRALARVANDASIGRVAWRALFAKDAAAWLPHSGAIAHCGLIQSSELIEWLETLGKSRTELAADALVGSALVSALRDSDLTIPEIRKAWDPWIEATFSNVSNVVESSHLLATWLGVTHSVEVFRDQVVTWLASHGDTRPAGRVYVAWLRAKGAKDVAKSLFDQWLHKHNNETFAYLSIRAWLDTDGDTDVALDAVIRWLASKLRSESLEARFLYRAWLRAGGDPEVVRAKIVGWLALHAEAPESNTVYGAWLQFAKRPDVVKEAIEKWCAIDSNAMRWNAYFVYWNWLNAEGSSEAINGLIPTWLATNDDSGLAFGARLEARNVFNRWLEFGHDPEQVRGSVMAWLSTGEQCQSDGAYFVYISWLRSTGDPEVIAGSMALWFPIHAHNLNCENVFSDWLKRCDSRWLKEDHRLVETIRNTVVTWLSIPANAASDGAFYAYFNWLEKGGEPSVIQSAVKNWLESELRTPHSPLPTLRSSWRQAGGAAGLFSEVPILTKALLEQGDADLLTRWLIAGSDPVEVRHAVVAWFSQSTNLGKRDATQLIRHWVARTGKVGLALVKSPVDQYLLANGTKVDAGYVIAEVLEVTGTGQLTEQYGQVSLRWLEHKNNAVSAAALYVYRAWLRSHRNIQVVETYLLRWLQIASNVRLKKSVGIYLAYATHEPKFPDWLLHAATDYLAASGDSQKHDDSHNADIATLRAVVLNHMPF